MMNSFERTITSSTEQDVETIKPTIVTNLMVSHGLCEAMIAAVKLGIFEYLDEVREVRTAEEIASDLSLSLDATMVLLDACVSVGLLVKEFSDENYIHATYSNTQETQHFLLQKSPRSLVESVNQYSVASKPLLANLEFAVREGSSQWHRTFNMSSEEIYRNLYADETKLITFVSSMENYTEQAANWLVTAFDLSQYYRMCDLGGAAGKLAYTASNVYPDMKITVLDLLPVVKVAPHFTPSVHECPNQGNVDFVAGDFFKGDLPAADLYCLTHILHNWCDDKGNLLMGKIFDKLPSGGGILINESLLDDDKRGPKAVTSLSLIMCVVTEGREKSGKEYKEILTNLGFTDVQYKPCPDRYYGGAVFAKKP